MIKEDIEKIPELVKSGKKSWEQVCHELVVFIICNKPMFGLHKYDEDFISDFIIQFLVRGPEALAEFREEKGAFLSYLFCMIKNIIISLQKKATMSTRIEYHNVNECIIEYEHKAEAYMHINYKDIEQPKVPFIYHPVSPEDFQIACKTDSYQIKRIINSNESEFENDIKEKLKGYSPKMIKNILMVLALKSSYYITDDQVEKISKLLCIDKAKMQCVIQELKNQMNSRVLHKEKIEIRRNRAYFNHRTIRDQIKWNDLNFSEPEYENYKLNKKYEKSTKNWATLNHQLEEGKINIRPTTKLIAKILGISPRQVTYYQTTARRLGIKICKV